MKKAVRKGASKAVALVLSLAMIFGMVPMVSASAGDTAGAQDNFDRIVHLDMGRKYYSPEWIKALIQEISALGYTELELDFSNNEGFRFSLPADQMKIEVGGYETVLVEVEPEEGAQDTEEPVTAVPLADEEAAVPAPTSTAQPEEGESEPAVTDEPESTPQYKEVEVFQSKSVDLSAALSADYITAGEMEDIIACADKAGIEIVPLLNSPGHMGAILSVYPDYRWTDDLGRTSNSTIDLENDEAVRFAEEMVRVYAQWFSEHGCTAFNIGADEFANDIGGAPGAVMGLDYIYNREKAVYSKLIEYINDLAGMVKGYGMTPRAFNDSFCYNNDTAYAPIKDIQICYWSSGWGNYKVASASTLEKQGYQLINTHGDYYYILGKDDCWDSSSKYKYNFSNNVFPGSTISDPVGSMFCIWSDYPNAETEQKVAEKVRVPLRIMAARMQDQEVNAGTVDTSVIPGGFNADGTINTDVPSTTVEDSTSGIKVTAPGLTDIKASKAEEVSALAGVPYVAYDIRLNDGEYSDRAQISIPLAGTELENADSLMGFVLEQNGSVTTIAGERNGTDFTFTAPHFSTVGVYDVSAMSTSVAGDYELFTGRTMEAGKYLIVYEYTHRSGWSEVTDYYALDANGNAVKVDVTDEGIITLDEKDASILWNFVQSGGNWAITDSEGQRMGMSGDYQSSIFGGGWWTITPHFDGSNSCDFAVTRSDSGWSIGAGVEDNGKLGTGYLVGSADWGGNVSFSGSTSKGELLLYKLAVPTYDVTIQYVDEENRVINTFKERHAAGVQSFTAPMTYGNYELTGDATQTANVKTDGSTVVTFHYKYVESVTPPENAANDRQLRIELWITNSQVHVDNYEQSNAYISVSRNAATSGLELSQLVPEPGYSFYDGTVELTYWRSQKLDKNHQQVNNGTDMTSSGVVFTQIRYNTTAKAWQVLNAQTGHWEWVLDDDQLVAYYMRETEVTSEVTTYMKDWGYETNNTTPNTSSGKGQVALSFVVVYPDGSYSATDSEIYSNATTIFNYDDNWKGSGHPRDIGLIVTENNDEYEVESIGITRGNRHANKDANVWYSSDSIDWQKDGDGRYVEQEVWNEDDGGDPMVNGTTDGYYFDGKNSAVLVLIHLRAIETESSLRVEYKVRGNEDPLYSYFIQVLDTSGQDPKTFLNSLWTNNSFVHNPGSVNLTDDAYIVNSDGNKQSINKNLNTIPGLELEARYEYDSAEISTDGKTLTLYYDRLASDYQFVVDYGLPVKINFAYLDINPNGLKSVVGTSDDMNVSADLAARTLTATPTRILSDITTITLTLTYTTTEGGTNTHEISVDFIPASTVYYEDSFVEYSDEWEVVGNEAAGRTQATSKLGDKDNIYGYDTAYANDITYSGGSAHKVTLTSGETATASFTFHGTGFQFVSMTDATSGCITVHVEGDGVDKYYFVDCYYQNGGALNQVPVMKVDNLPLGTYTVTVTAGHLSSFDWNKDGESTFVLDGIRIYEPVGDYENYKQDNEGSAVYSEIRNILIDGYWDPSNSVYVDTLKSSTSDVTKYLKVGPNNEVYLKNGDKITFTVPKGGSIVQIGAKLVSDSEMTFTVNGQSQSITSAAEMYYPLKDVNPGAKITITATGDGILSLTNLKLVSGS